MTANRPETLTDFRRIGKRKLGCAAEDAKALHDKRAAARYTPPTSLRAQKALIPLGSHSEPIPANHSRCKNWRSDVPALKSGVRDINMGRYSSRCKYTHYEYQQQVQSYGAVAGSCMYARISGQSHFYRPWRGWTWAVDANGIHLRSADGRDDYHPTASDLLTCTVQQLAEKARENGKTRRANTRLLAQQKRQTAERAKHERQVIRRAEAEGATVCLKDSLRAGNCAGGSSNWAQRHGLNPTQHYRPLEVLDLANGDTDRVAIVVAVALRRHAREMETGLCELADHRTE